MHAGPGTDAAHSRTSIVASNVNATVIEPDGPDMQQQYSTLFGM